MQSIGFFGVDKIAASTLEGFKDLPIAATSFLFASQLPRLGYRNAIIAGLGVVCLACLAMPLLPSFWTARILFLAVGIGFAVSKIGVYSLVGLLTEGPDEHASLLNTIEGGFMVGVLGGYWMFSAFINPTDATDSGWLNVYWVLAAMCALSITLLVTIRFDESQSRDRTVSSSRRDEFLAMLRLVSHTLIIVFVVSVFLYVLVEQGIGSWLPTFNREILGLSAPMSVQAASIFAAGLAVGRLASGLVVRKTGWFPLLTGCLVAMSVLLVVALPLASGAGRPVTHWSNAPLATFVLPLIGVCMAPIYPAMNSAILSAMPRSSHAAMVGLIVVFSALGGTTGSFIIGRAFASLRNGSHAFYLLLIPIAGLGVGFLALRASIQKNTAAQSF